MGEEAGVHGLVSGVDYSEDLFLECKVARRAGVDKESPFIVD